MTIATRVGAYLDAHNIRYDTVAHAPSQCAMDSAHAAQIAPASIAKAVMLEDHQGHQLMAVLPANHKISLDSINRQMQAQLHLLEEERVYQLFDDCEPGAVPALGAAYNLNAIYDEALERQDDLYLESGDHRTLIHLSAEQFGALMKDTRHGLFSNKVYH